MTTGAYDIVLQQGEDFSHTFTVVGVDFTSYVAGAAQMRVTFADAAPTLTFVVVVASTGINTGTLTISAARASVNAITPGLYEWDCFLESATASPIRLLAGVVSVLPRVTR